VIAAAGVSDDFNKKMQEWETKKKKGMIRSKLLSRKGSINAFHQCTQERLAAFVEFRVSRAIIRAV
jgi:hypothetical protein